jgi:hypothetical protein
MRKILTIVCLLSFCGTNAQKFSIFSKSVGLITFIDSAKNKISFGTGTLILKPNNFDKRLIHVYLVTNRHVLPNVAQALSIQFKIRNSTVVDSFVTLNIPIYDQNKKLLSNIKYDLLGEDVSVIRIDSYYSQLRFLDTFLIPYDQIASKKNLVDNKIDIGTPIFFLGYPALFYHNKNISPILRRGFIASDPINQYYFSDYYKRAFYQNLKEVPAEKLDGFLIDASVFGGSSGSLVYSNLSALDTEDGSLSLGFRPTYVLGIATYSYPDANENIGQKINIGGVISSEVIKRTIDLF